MRLMLVAGLAALSPLALAQGPATGPAPPPATASSAAPPASPAGAPPAGEQGAETEPKKPVRPATGYGWSRRPPAGPSVPSSPSAPRPRGKVRAAARPKPKKDLTEVWQPGFEPQPGANSTFFVNLSRKSVVEEKKSEGRLVYVIKGARAALRNNRNPLMTTFFATPVSSARLVQVKDDVQLVLTLKHPASATWAFAPAGALTQLRVVFGPQAEARDPAADAGKVEKADKAEKADKVEKVDGPEEDDDDYDDDESSDRN